MKTTTVRIHKPTQEKLKKLSAYEGISINVAIGYYLRQQSEVEVYLRQRKQQTEKVREDNERRFNPQDVRARLLARRGRKGRCRLLAN